LGVLFESYCEFLWEKSYIYAAIFVTLVYVMSDTVIFRK